MPGCFGPILGLWNGTYRSPPPTTTHPPTPGGTISNLFWAPGATGCPSARPVAFVVLVYPHVCSHFPPVSSFLVPSEGWRVLGGSSSDALDHATFNWSLPRSDWLSCVCICGRPSHLHFSSSFLLFIFTSPRPSTSPCVGRSTCLHSLKPSYRFQRAK